MGSLLLGAAKMLLMVQASQAAVAGTIRDGESGEPIPDAVVALPDIDQAVMSDSRGRYRFPTAPPGPQHVTVKRIGYAPRTLHALVPSDGQLEINVALHPEPLRLQPIVVRAAVAVRGVEDEDSTTFPDRGMTLAAVRNHPLLAEPDVFHALGGGEIVLSPESPSGVHVRGGASDHTAYLLDGIPVFSPYHA
ncbi:MAG: carboxypeptidase regulatory-like domain-containing protein, partial [Gemmatimonadales bacterium]